MRAFGPHATGLHILVGDIFLQPCTIIERGVEGKNKGEGGGLVKEEQSHHLTLI